MPESAAIVSINNSEARTLESPFFSPSSIVAIFNAATVTKEERKIIQIRGVFKKTGTVNYSGNYYNKLKDEAGDNSITLLTPAVLHNQLEDNKTIELNGFITRKLDKEGRIEIRITLIDIIAQQANKFSEEETKKILLINKKVDQGFKDLDAHIKSSIFNNKRISIKVIMGKSAIIDSDIKRGMETAIALYDIEYHKVSLSAPEEIVRQIKFLDTQGADVICVARGGGENLEIFEDLKICDSILERTTIIASAIGHAANVSLFEKLADKKFITPTAFGNYLKEIHNQTVEELQNSKAKLVQDITLQLSANYNKQIQNLNDQLTLSTELHEKTVLEMNNNFLQKEQNLNLKLKGFEELVTKTSQENAQLHKKEVEGLKSQVLSLQAQYSSQDVLLKQANSLASNYQKQLQEAQSKTSTNIAAIFIAAIVGFIIGLILFRS